MGHGRLHTTWGAGTVALLLATTLAAPAAAAPPGAGDDRDRLPRHSSDLIDQAPFEVSPRVADQDVRFFRIPGEQYPVGPGLRFSSFDQYDARGWFRAQVMTANLGKKKLQLDYVGPKRISQRETVKKLLKRRKAVAGVNADFFDIGDTGAPLGIGVERGRGLIHGRTEGWNNVFTLNKKNVARITQAHLVAQVTRGDGARLKVTNLNSPTVLANGIGIYTPAWGRAGRTRVVDNARNVREVVIRNGRVVANRGRLSGNGAVPKRTVVLVGRDKGANRLKRLKVGARVKVRYRLSQGAKVAVGGSGRLLAGGRVVAVDDGPMHPRTAIGIDRDKGRLLVLTVDGRQSSSRGLTLVETARVLRDLGAEDAINLDGGGSTTMLARRPGRRPQVANSPSDGGMRAVPNGLGFTVKKSNGKRKGIRIEGRSGPLQVFPGLRRTVRAFAHDRTKAPAPLGRKPRWRSTADLVKGKGKAAVVRGTTPGSHRITVRSGKTRGKAKLTVLGTLARIDTDRSAVSVARSGTAYFTVNGYDAAGATAPVDPKNVSLSYNSSLATIRPTGDGRFKVTGGSTKGAMPVTVDVAGRRAVLGVSVAGAALPASALYDTAPWVSPVVATQATGTRVAVIADSRVAPGRANRIDRLRTGLQQAAADGAELVIGAGDLAESGRPADLQQAKQIFTEELGAIPFELVPGDAENAPVQGGSTHTAIGSVYGNTATKATTLGTTRLLFVNTGAGSFAGSSFGRLVILRDQLAAAAADPAVRSVVVVGHHPPVSTTHGVALQDTREARLLLQVLQHFRKTSGKATTFVAGHGARFGALRHERVDLVNVGSINRADGPTPGGGHAGWAMLGLGANGSLGAEFHVTVGAQGGTERPVARSPDDPPVTVSR